MLKIRGSHLRGLGTMVAVTSLTFVGTAVAPQLILGQTREIVKGTPPEAGEVWREIVQADAIESSEYVTEDGELVVETRGSDIPKYLVVQNFF